MTQVQDLWAEWRRFVQQVLDQGRPMTDEERQRAEELAREAKRKEREARRRAKRLARGGEWVEKQASL